MRQSGIDVLGDIAWGTHFCLFYDTTADLLETLASYCKAGLEHQELCLWIIAPPVTEDDARQALRPILPELDRYLADGSLVFCRAHDWYVPTGAFDIERALHACDEMSARGLAKGYAGFRITGDTAWLERKHWEGFCEYEHRVNATFAGERVALLCTYPLSACGAPEVLDVMGTHKFAIARRRGRWHLIETAGYAQANAEVVKRQRAEALLADEREKRRLLQAELARVSRLTTVNELLGSQAHDVDQTITDAMTDANTCVRWLTQPEPKLEEARAAARDTVQNATRATEIIRRMRRLVEKDGPEYESIDVNVLIGEIAGVVAGEAARNGVAIRQALTTGLPCVLGDRVQLQQVLLNLLMNSIEATKNHDEPREITLASVLYRDDLLAVSVADTGVGLPANAGDIFNAFVTTKPGATGMGLAISRSIIETHGGRLWATANADRGATFSLTLPISPAQ